MKRIWKGLLAGAVVVSSALVMTSKADASWLSRALRGQPIINNGRYYDDGRYYGNSYYGNSYYGYPATTTYYYNSGYATPGRGVYYYGPAGSRLYYNPNGNTATPWGNTTTPWGNVVTRPGYYYPY